MVSTPPSPGSPTNDPLIPEVGFSGQDLPPSKLRKLPNLKHVRVKSTISNQVSNQDNSDDAETLHQDSRLSVSFRDIMRAPEPDIPINSPPSQHDMLPSTSAGFSSKHQLESHHSCLSGRESPSSVLQCESSWIIPKHNTQTSLVDLRTAVIALPYASNLQVICSYPADEEFKPYVRLWVRRHLAHDVTPVKVEGSNDLYSMRTLLPRDARVRVQLGIINKDGLCQVDRHVEFRSTLADVIVVMKWGALKSRMKMTRPGMHIVFATETPYDRARIIGSCSELAKWNPRLTKNQTDLDPNPGLSIIPQHFKSPKQFQYKLVAIDETLTEVLETDNVVKTVQQWKGDAIVYAKWGDKEAYVTEVPLSLLKKKPKGLSDFAQDILRRGSYSHRRIFLSAVPSLDSEHIVWKGEDNEVESVADLTKVDSKPSTILGCWPRLRKVGTMIFEPEPSPPPRFTTGSYDWGRTSISWSQRTRNSIVNYSPCLD